MTEAAFDEDQIELPPMFVKILGDIKSDQKKLRTTPALGKNTEELRQFVALTMYPRLMSMLKILAAATSDTYGLAANTATRLDRLRNFVDDVFEEELGIEPTDGRVHGIDPATIDQLLRTLFTLSGVLDEKLPGDPQVGALLAKAIAIGKHISEQNMVEPPPRKKKDDEPGKAKDDDGDDDPDDDSGDDDPDSEDDEPGEKDNA